MHSRTSRALPIVRPSGTSICVRSAATRRPERSARPTSASASARASSSRTMKAPLPVLTSSTRASMPSAIFLLRMEAQMSGRLSTVAVTSRSA